MLIREARTDRARESVSPDEAGAAGAAGAAAFAFAPVPFFPAPVELGAAGLAAPALERVVPDALTVRVPRAAALGAGAGSGRGAFALASGVV